MCGLVGVAGAITPTEKAVFADLLVVDQLRGTDSVGILTVDLQGKTRVVKSLDTPADFVRAKSTGEAQFGTMRLLMGHNRWKTKGAVNVANAHPFQFPSVIGAHNGTLRDQTLLPDHQTFDVDSENIYHAFDTLGVQATTPLLNGAYALTWFDVEDHSVNLLRNAERPLYFCSSADEKTIFWASESWMLVGILSRHKVKHGPVMLLNIHKQLSIPLGIGFGSHFKPLGAPVVTDITPFHKPANYRAYPPVKSQTSAKDSAETLERELSRKEKKRLWKKLKRDRKAQNDNGAGASHESKKTDPTIYNKQTTGKTTYRSKELNNSLSGKTIQFTVTALETFSKGDDIKLVGRRSKGGNDQVTCWLDSGRDDLLISLLDVDGHEFNATVSTNYPNTGVSGVINIDPTTITLNRGKPAATENSGGTQSTAMSTNFFALGFNDAPLTKDEFYKLVTADGCACCNNKIVPQWKVKDCEWISPDDFFCPSCVGSKDEETQDYLRQLRNQFAQANQHNSK